jgi:hypothetical protein
MLPCISHQVAAAEMPTIDVGPYEQRFSSLSPVKCAKGDYHRRAWVSAMGPSAAFACAPGLSSVNDGLQSIMSPAPQLRQIRRSPSISRFSATCGLSCEVLFAVSGLGGALNFAEFDPSGE